MGAIGDVLHEIKGDCRMPATIIKAGGDFYILFGKQCDMLKSRYSELRRGVLFATPFLVAGLLLILVTC